MSIEAKIIPREAATFLSELSRKFTPRLEQLLEARKSRQLEFDNGSLPDFNPDTANVREAEWQVASIPDDILDRRVEITGPPDRKMVINALNSGANVFMADFEDSFSPRWAGLLQGQLNLKEALRGTITYQHPTKGLYELTENPAVLFVRPRGLHLVEAHFKVDDCRCPASLFDFGLYMWHNAKWLVDNDRAPYFYLPKLEHYSEAKWWNDVFCWAQDYIGIPRGTIRATVLLETLPAAFQMDEILYELKDHSAGLNCGRWDYIFSYVKTFKNDSSRVLPDRSQVTMESPFMTAYSRLVIQTCHRRGVHAMGGMAAQIPIRDDSVANSDALEKVYSDKYREVLAGHDGTWVAHPGLVSLAKDVFDEFMPTVNQIDKKTDYKYSREDLLRPPIGSITRCGLRQNVDVGIRYLAAWLEGYGCVPLYNLMEDAATAEISRTQIWQWVKHGVTLDDGDNIDAGLVEALISKIVWDDPALEPAAHLFMDLCLGETLVDFLTTPAYERIVNDER